jgi:hypothetical protein
MTNETNPAYDVSDHLLTCGPCNGQPGDCSMPPKETKAEALDRWRRNL